MAIEHLRFAPEILKRLGEELVPHPDLGIIELIRNSYDADATSCDVELLHLNSPNALLRVSDVGDGMTEQNIRDGYLLLGKSAKVEDRLTPKGRQKVGEKGLGRLAAMRLGRVARLSTRPKSDPGTQYSVEIDWDRFDSVAAIDDVDLEVSRTETEDPPGTTIEVSQLRNTLAANDLQRLARSIVMLTGPFSDLATDFKVQLNVPEYAEIERIVRSGFFEASTYTLRASLNEMGHAYASLIDSAGNILREADHYTLAGALDGQSNLGFFAPPATFEIWMFNRNRPNFSTEITPALRKAFTAWLDEVGGVHVYQRRLRVLPYGDKGFDWLEMNVLSRRNPEERPGTNNSVGRIVLGDGGHSLIPKTDRMGFVENLEFEQLREFARAALEWAAHVRLELRDKKQQQEKARSRKRVVETTKLVDEALRLAPASIRPTLEKAIKDEREAKDERLQVVENDLMLYRTLSTVGTTTAVFAHETLRPVDTIAQMITSVRRNGVRELGSRYDLALKEQVDIIDGAAASLRTFAELPLQLLRQRKRKYRNVDPGAISRQLIGTFEHYLNGADVTIDYDLADPAVTVRATIASIEAIVANFLANSVATFAEVGSNSSIRRILVRTARSSDEVVLSILDTGPGIRHLTEDEVWLPGKSTRAEGTGMGLTIVRDIVSDLQGHCWAVSHGELGGAEFHVALPAIDA